MIDHVFVRAQDIRQQQLISIPVHIQRFIDGNLHLCLIVSAQVHQNFIFNAPGSIGGKFDLLLRIKGIDRLDQSDSSDGDQILHTNARIVKFLGNIDNETQIMFDQSASRFPVIAV